MLAPAIKSRRQHLRLWFEYLRLCHRIFELRPNLIKSAEFYAPWGDIQNVKFDEWWKAHHQLFGETSVQVVDAIRPHPNVIHLAVPLNLPVSRSLHQIEGIIQSKQKKRLLELGKNPADVKSKSVGFGQYEFTPGVEVRGNTLNEILLIYGTWIEMDRPMVNSRFCAVVRERFLARPRSKWVPYLLQRAPQKDKNGNLRFDEDQIRQIRRYLKRGQEVCRSVSAGDFPGRAILR